MSCVWEMDAVDVLVYAWPVLPFSTEHILLVQEHLGLENREQFLVCDSLCFCETWLDMSVIMHVYSSSESKLHVEHNDLQWSLHPCFNSRRRSNIFLEVVRDERRHVCGPQTQSQDYEVSEKGASASFNNVCCVFFNRALNRKKKSHPHTLPPPFCLHP